MHKITAGEQAPLLGSHDVEVVGAGTSGLTAAGLLAASLGLQTFTMYADDDAAARSGSAAHLTPARGGCAYSGRVSTPTRRHRCPS